MQALRLLPLLDWIGRTELQICASRLRVLQKQLVAGRRFAVNRSWSLALLGGWFAHCCGLLVLLTRSIANIRRRVKPYTVQYAKVWLKRITRLEAKGNFEPSLGIRCPRYTEYVRSTVVRTVLRIKLQLDLSVKHSLFVADLISPRRRAKVGSLSDRHKMYQRKETDGLGMRGQRNSKKRDRRKARKEARKRLGIACVEILPIYAVAPSNGF